MLLARLDLFALVPAPSFHQSKGALVGCRSRGCWQPPCCPPPAPLAAEGARHHQDGEIKQGSLKARVRRREALPGYVPTYYKAPFGFGCSYLVGLPGTEREETGELTACDQGAIPAAAGCEESSYPAGKSKGNSNAQRRLLFTQHHLPPSLVFCTVPDPIRSFHLAANTSHVCTGELQIQSYAGI